MAVRTALIEALAKDMGWDGSESESEAFVINLKYALNRTIKQMSESHKEGLSLDCVRVLTEELNK